MPEPAQINRSLSTIRTELEFLLASNVLSQPQMQSIMAVLSSFPILLSSVIVILRNCRLRHVRDGHA
jgi:hypothetical protein